MEDYAAYLVEEAKSDIVALHQFRLLYDISAETYHFFFEGEEDSLFYMPEARRRVGDATVNIYDCGGKKNVVEVRDTIKSDGYDLGACLFFVDRDFDDLLGTQVNLDNYTYITDSYSIENEVSTIFAVRIILEDIVRISRADPEFRKIESNMRRAFSEFYMEIRPLIAWILAAKASGCAPNLQNTVGLKGIVSLEGNSPAITSQGFKDFKKKVTVNGKVPKISEVINWRRKLDAASAKMWTRGKYDIWFFQNYLLRALEDTNRTRKAAGGKAVRVPSSLREGRIFELLGGRIVPPPSLMAFYDARLR